MTAVYVILGMTESDYTTLKTAGELYFRYESELIECAICCAASRMGC